MIVTIKDKNGRQVFRGDSEAIEVEGGVLLALSDLESTALLLAAEVKNTSRAAAGVLARIATRIRKARARRIDTRKRRLFRDMLASMPDEIKER